MLRQGKRKGTSTVTENGARSPRNAGFTLMELIGVIAIIAVMAALFLPSLGGVLRATSLNRAGQMITDQLALARQEAVTRNCDVEVRFYEVTTGANPGWRAVELLRVERTPTGVESKPIGRITFLPEGVVMANRNGLSPLISSGPLAGTAALPAYGLQNYRGFRFRPNGSVESQVGESNYLTLILNTDSANPPMNYYTIQVNVMTGRAGVFRP